jgi:hypothetical protein
MSARTKITTVIGIIVLVATIAIFAIARPVFYPSTGVGFGFLIYGEIVFFCGFAVVEYWAQKSSQIMTWTGVGIPVGAYALFVIISSILYMMSRSSFVRGFLILQMILLAAAAVVTLIMAGASKGRAQRDKKVLQADTMVKEFEAELMLIRELTERKSDVDKLIEGIKYSDTSVMVDADVELNDAISNLENIVRADELGDDDFDKAIKDIEFLIKKRNLQTRNAKQGGI